MKKQKSIRIRMAYLTKNLAKIVGKKKEVIHLPAGSRSGDFIDFMIERYPQVFEKYGPGYLGFTRNGEKPKVLMLLQDGDQYEFADWTDEEIRMDDTAKRLSELGAVMELPHGEFKPPAWWECTWRRVACGKDDCSICGKIKQDRLRHIMKGEDPDDMKSAFEDVGNSLAGALRMLKEQMEEAGIELENVGEAEMEEPPKPEEFPLYQKVSMWRQEAEVLADSAEQSESLWLATEAAADFLWYKNTLAVKTYRQLCNRWHLARGDKYGEFDLQYTGYVLEECIKILKQSLAQLSELNSPQKGGLMIALTRLADLEKQILEI
ncbi:MAG: hypothetical protein HYT98_04655 [Candidatus Sungbacteria bacterium]|nr:hypothetical protein [Candidatus Sungbacteria bacterium]